MLELTTKIGDHIIQINYTLKNQNQVFLRNFHPFNGLEVRTPNLTIKIKDGFGAPFIGYHVDISKGEDKIVYRRADYLLEVDANYTHATLLVYDDFALKHGLLNLYSAFLVHRKWGLLIHSSCVIEKRKAHIFAGQSGAGKSTAAKLSYPRKLLSDEATLVKISPKGIKVYNSPFRSELAAEEFDGAKKLASIQLLHQSLKNTRTILSKSDSYINLMDKVFYWPHSEKEVKTINRLMGLLVKNVPVYHLNFQKNNTFWELIS